MVRNRWGVVVTTVCRSAFHGSLVTVMLALMMADVLAQAPVRQSQLVLANRAGSCRGIEVAAIGGRVYAFAARHEGAVLHVIDVTDPTQPRTCATLDPPLGDLWNEPKYHDGWLFTGHRGGGLNLIDVSDPCNPSVVDTQSTNYHFKGMWVHEISGTPYLFESEHDASACCGGLRVYDFSLGQLGWVGSALDPNWDGGDLRVTPDHYAYQLDPGRRVSGVEPVQLTIYDVFDPASPRRLHRVSIGNAVENQSPSYDLIMANEGDWLITGNGKDGLRIIDIRDRFNPQVVATHAREGISVEGVEFLDEKESQIVVTYRKRSGERALAAASIRNLPHLTPLWVGVAKTPVTFDVQTLDGVIYMAVRNAALQPTIEIWK